MRFFHLVPLLAALLLALGASPVLLAQEANPATEAAPETTMDELTDSEDLDVSRIDQILRGEQEVLQGEVFAYDPAGRRDPFKSLLEGREAEEEGEAARPPGLEGMLIEELKLEGIIQTQSGILAFVQGRDSLSYIIRAGTKLYNGEVYEIMPGRVVFRQQVNDPKQLVPYQEIVREIAD